MKLSSTSFKSSCTAAENLLKLICSNKLLPFTVVIYATLQIRLTLSLGTLQENSISTYINMECINSNIYYSFKNCTIDK